MCGVQGEGASWVTSVVQKVILIAEFPAESTLTESLLFLPVILDWECLMVTALT